MDLFGKILLPYNPEPYYAPGTPIQQQTISIPHLFVDAEREYTTVEWFESLRRESHLYRDCYVVSVTMAKAITSPLSHEFIQFIVEDSSTGVRTRIFSDRRDPKGKLPDCIIIGRNWSSAYNPSGQVDLPMPLLSIDYKSGGRPPLLEFAQIMATITLREPEYKITSTMCWWYAGTVMIMTAFQYTGRGEVKRWKFEKYASKMLVWDNFDFFTPRKQMEEDARRFKDQNVEGMSYQAPTNAKKILTSDDYLKDVTTMLQSEETQKEYAEALRIDKSQALDTEKLHEVIQEVKTIDADAQAPPITIADMQEASKVFTETLLNEPDKDKNLAAYEAQWQKNQRLVSRPCPCSAH
ncbi:hypothetical protein NX059_009022 [Plenodomus lindquistii]|nr:hypothetical protein NX059_009022 [Plenodomus lindquistii]